MKLVEYQLRHLLAEALCKLLNRFPQWSSRTNGVCFKSNSAKKALGCGIMAIVAEGQPGVRAGAFEFALNGICLGFGDRGFIG